MPKATITLPSGAVAQIEGSTEEVKALLDFYAVNQGSISNTSEHAVVKVPSTSNSTSSKSILAEIVSTIKDCDQSENIDKNILQKSHTLDCVLLPLYVVRKYLGNNTGLSSGEIGKIGGELGVSISQSLASHTLAGSASKYVIGDKLKVKGQTVRYKLSNRGLQYLSEIITGRKN